VLDDPAIHRRFPLLSADREKDKPKFASCPTGGVNPMVGFPWKYSREPTFVETAIMAPLFSRYVRPALLRAALSCIAMLTVVAPAAAQDLPYAQGRLWMVEVAGAAPSFLVGTMHSADPAVATPWPALAHVMDAVDSVTVELVLDDEATKAMGQAMVLTDGRVLGDIAGPDRMAHIEAVGAMYGMPPEALQQFRPWAVNMLFSLPPSELQRQATGAAMLDNVLRQHDVGQCFAAACGRPWHRGLWHRDDSRATCVVRRL
jgi:hypothetical protein